VLYGLLLLYTSPSTLDPNRSNLNGPDPNRAKSSTSPNVYSGRQNHHGPLPTHASTGTTNAFTIDMRGTMISPVGRDIVTHNHTGPAPYNIYNGPVNQYPAPSNFSPTAQSGYTSPISPWPGYSPSEGDEPLELLQSTTQS
jgi:hypothetical protein